MRVIGISGERAVPIRSDAPPPGRRTQYDPHHQLLIMGLRTGAPRFGVPLTGDTPCGGMIPSVPASAENLTAEDEVFAGRVTID